MKYQDDIPLTFKRQVEYDGFIYNGNLMLINN